MLTPVFSENKQKKLTVITTALGHLPGGHFIRKGELLIPILFTRPELFSKIQYPNKLQSHFIVAKQNGQIEFKGFVGDTSLPSFIYSYPLLRAYVKREPILKFAEHVLRKNEFMLLKEYSNAVEQRIEEHVNISPFYTKNKTNGYVNLSVVKTIYTNYDFSKAFVYNGKIHVPFKHIAGVINKSNVVEIAKALLLHTGLLFSHLDFLSAYYISVYDPSTQTLNLINYDTNTQKAYPMSRTKLSPPDKMVINVLQKSDEVLLNYFSHYSNTSQPVIDYIGKQIYLARYVKRTGKIHIKYARAPHGTTALDDGVRVRLPDVNGTIIQMKTEQYGLLLRFPLFSI